MKFQPSTLFLACFLLLITVIQNSDLNSTNQADQQQQSAGVTNYPEVVVHMEPSTLDIREEIRKAKESRHQRRMVKDIEEKINVDRQAFQQILSIQSAQIQKLSELLKMNNFYAMKKVTGAVEQKEAQEKAPDKLSKMREISLISDPFDMVKDDETRDDLQAHAQKSPLNTYNEIVDSIYGV